VAVIGRITFPSAATSYCLKHLEFLYELNTGEHRYHDQLPFRLRSAIAQLSIHCFAFFLSRTFDTLIKFRDVGEGLRPFPICAVEFLLARITRGRRLAVDDFEVGHDCTASAAAAISPRAQATLRVRK
jgi:hypothetical protein